MLDVLSSICQAAKEEIPLTGGKKRKDDDRDKLSQLVPGWKDQIAPWKDTAEFWYSVWLSAEKPVNCELHNIMKRTKNQYHYQVRRVKKLADSIRSNKLLEAAMSGNADLLKEMKRVKSSQRQTEPDNVDKKRGDDIPEQFANVYEELYNSVDDEAGLEQLYIRLEEAGISASDVDNITPEVVKEAVGKLKSGKTDVSGQFHSDTLLHAPDTLFVALSQLFKAFFIHEDFSFDILCCAFMPLLKGALKDDTDSNNYRAIAISSLLLKILDNVILILYGDVLSSDILQFGYKKKTSGTQCSWVVLEVVSYFKRHDTPVMAAFCDMTKAFDMCVFSTLFGKVLDRKVPAIIVRGLLWIYRYQRCWVRWSTGAVSRQFGVSNSTRQGSCLSPCLYSVYCDNMLQELRDSGAGCYAGDVFVGAVSFADDLAILAPSRDGLQKLLDICDRYAASHNLQFSTHPDANKSKTKTVYFPVGRERRPAQLSLCGRLLPWVDQAAHLGHEIHKSGSPDVDCNMARGRYIGTSSEVLAMFDFATPEQKLTAIQTYCCSWYGSMLWEFYSDTAEKAFRAWSTTVKIATISHDTPEPS